MKPEALPAGVILAGGLSRRMPGPAKALVLLNGQPLIQHVIDRLCPQVSALVLSVDVEKPFFDGFGYAQIEDPRPGNHGPLGGLLAAMNALPQGSDRLLMAPCDAPFLPLDLGSRLTDTLVRSGRPVCTLRYAAQLQPTFSLWHRSVLPDLRKAVMQDGLGGFKQFLDRLKPAILDWESAPVSPFFNINTPADLARAMAVLE